MDSRKEMLVKIIMDDITAPGFNAFLMKLQFQCEQYCIEEDMVSDMHLPLNKIQDTTQFNL
jgi:hypothetical protein